MGDLYLGYASFTYYVIEMHHYNFEKSGKEHISFVCEGKQFFIDINFDAPHAECGYVFINSEDLKTIFNENTNLSDDLREKCWRRKGALLPGEKDWHCHIPDELKGHIDIKPASGDRAFCRQKPVC